MIKYEIPSDWAKYSKSSIVTELVEAKTAIQTLKNMPYQRSWVENLQQMELKREVAGTSRIEGADFTEKEFEDAIKDSPEELITRSQKQAHAAMKTYKWIATIPDDRPIDADLILEIHRKIVTGADDDHCPPGQLRTRDDNVTFGQPRHRGASGGDECRRAFEGVVSAIRNDLNKHDPLIRALAAHYHFAAIHPFFDGNGRTARALEALLLQRAGLRDFCFIAMSNHYYDEKSAYLFSLAAVRNSNYDLTVFLKFGLNGIAIQSRRVLKEIQLEVKKGLYRNMMYDLYGKLKTPKKRVIAKRQKAILELLLQHDELTMVEIFDRTRSLYIHLKNPIHALGRDIVSIFNLGAIGYEKQSEDKIVFKPKLDWPTLITESEFFERIKNLPKAKDFPF